MLYIKRNIKKGNTEKIKRKFYRLYDRKEVCIKTDTRPLCIKCKEKGKIKLTQKNSFINNLLCIGGPDLCKSRFSNCLYNFFLQKLCD